MSRATKFNDELKAKIKEGFSKGLNKSEVCLYAGISRPSLDKYLDPEKHKRFSAECELLKSNVRMHAKINIAEKIIDEQDLSTSKYYLEKEDEKMKKTLATVMA